MQFRKQNRSNRGFSNTARLDDEIQKLEQTRSALLRRRPPRLTHAAQPTFGAIAGNGEAVVGTFAYNGNKLPRSAPQWGWGHVEKPSQTHKIHTPPNLYGTFREDNLPTERNTWSTCQRSHEHPLKTLLLDDSKRNIPRHRCRSELLASRKRINIPHMSFDVDMDGVVSELDMKYAKAYDLDGDGILSNQERSLLRHAMAKDLYQENQTVQNLSETPLTETELEAAALKLSKSTNFTEDFNRIQQRKKQGAIAGAAGGISALQQHFRHKENRDYGLATDHNATSVKTHNHGWLDKSTGTRRRCISRSELLEQRRIDFRATAKLAAFKPDGKELLFRRKADSSIQPTAV